jgi:hypothetical protein
VIKTVNKDLDTMNVSTRIDCDSSSNVFHRKIDASNIINETIKNASYVAASEDMDLSNICQANETPDTDDIDTFNINTNEDVKTWVAETINKVADVNITANTNFPKITEDTELRATNANTDLDLHENTESSVKKKFASKDDESLFTSITPKNVRTSLPDFLPSRRSVRKKQSTSSDDFEYYTPGFKRKEVK